MNENTQDLAQAIEKSKSEVTVLFTDIVNSTQFWDKKGDTAGRLMLNLHNKLLFPVVKAYHGTVIKTIGDSIMASFKSPMDGVRAAIAMQQRVRKRRREDKRFDIHIRIGVHTGLAIVETNDVYGDTVNMAARVESAAKSDEILVSQATAQRLRRRKTRFGLTRRRSFVPKGKRRTLIVWTCDWHHCKSQIDDIKRQPAIPPNKRQRLELLGFLSATLITIYFLYTEFIRFLLADSEILALYVINPHPIVKILLFVIAIVLLVLAVAKIFRYTRMPIGLFRVIKGGFGFGLLFFVFVGIFQWIDGDATPYWSRAIYKTRNAFVEVVADNVGIRSQPKRNALVITVADKGSLYLHQKTIGRANRQWVKVHLREEGYPYGYIRHRRPPQIGVPTKQLIERKRFAIRYYHLYALGLGLLGFVWGVISFRLRPL